MSDWMKYFYNQILGDYRDSISIHNAKKAAAYADDKSEKPGFIYCCFLDYFNGLQSK